MRYHIKSSDSPIPPFLFFSPSNPLVTRCEWEGSFPTPPTPFPLTPSPSSPFSLNLEGVIWRGLRANKIVNEHSVLKIRKGQQKLYPGNKIMENNQKHDVHAFTRVEKSIGHARKERGRLRRGFDHIKCKNLFCLCA